MSNTLRVWLGTQPAYTQNGGSTLIPKQHVVITSAGGGIQQLQQRTSKGLYLLMTISGLVLLVACANVANLLLARGTTRKAETSIRMALGAARSRLVRQMLTESVLLACSGRIGRAGGCLRRDADHLVLGLSHAPHVPIEASPSMPVLGFAFLLSLVTGIVFGIVPAWLTSHSDPAEALRGVNRSTRDRASLPQKSLIVFQAALSSGVARGRGLADQEPAQSQRASGLRTCKPRIATWCIWTRLARAIRRRSCRRCTRRWNSALQRCPACRVLGWRSTARWRATIGEKAFAWKDAPSRVPMSTTVLPGTG